MVLNCGLILCLLLFWCNIITLAAVLMTEYEVTSDTYENPGVFVTILKFITIKNVDQIGYLSVLIFMLGSWLTSNFSTM